MGIDSIQELKGVRASKIDASWKRTYKRAFRVFTTDVWTGALEVRQAIPVVLGARYEVYDGSGTPREFDDFAFATDIEAVIDSACNDDRQWLVTVSYGPWNPTEFPENPLDAPLRISYGGSRFQRVVEQTIPDEDDVVKAVVNSAGDYFDPPILIDDSRPTIQIVRNEPHYDQNYAILWKDTLNSDTWFGFDPYTVKLSMPTAELSYNPVCNYYYQVTYSFEVNLDGWKKKILDQGMKIWDGSSTKPTPAKDKDGADVTSPVLLNGVGQQLTIGDDPIYLEFDVYYEADFSLLSLSPELAPGHKP